MGAPLPNLQRSFLARKKGGKGGAQQREYSSLVPSLGLRMRWVGVEGGAGMDPRSGKVVLPRCKSVY